MNASLSTFKLVAAALASASLLTLSACGNSEPTTSMPGMNMTTTMPGAHDMATGDGLSDTEYGLTFKPGDVVLTSGKPQTWTFQVIGPDGKPVTRFTPEQTKLMHFYAVRDDLTGYQHLHPTRAADGTWTVDLASLDPGNHRFYIQFTADGTDGRPVTPILSVPVTVPGDYVHAPLPAASPSTVADGYTVTLDTGSGMMAGHGMPLTVTITKDGQPVSNLQPYLESYAHLTAIHERDLAIAHLHPENPVTGNSGGPELDFAANFPKAGNWRLFIQFQVDGVLHTAAITMTV
ncbi:hypothetical protein [Smaragdicoccus niigatensis]|uniref:hypothetical protein n=1 Tax=Smaragdicoccus niigatensis TaxID=359359 RepID=UPI0003A4F67E|nr:hypothetical protein [Smaragdicoccus niigatensis]